MTFVCLFELIEELVKARNFKFSMVMENGLSYTSFNIRGNIRYLLLFT